MEEIFATEKNRVSRYRNGNLDTVLVGEQLTVETAVGKLIPRFTIEEDSGRKKEAPVKFYKTGELKVLPLEEFTSIPTSIGDVKSELVVFYKSGALWRTFPLNGKVTGFWTEENEYNLAEILSIPTSVGFLNIKPIYLQFYETGELESVLFWPNESVKINLDGEEIPVRLGISFHTNGQVKGFEPAVEIPVQTPVGVVQAFDPDPNGMQAEMNSISYHEDGSIHSVTTASNQFSVYSEGQLLQTYAPKLVPGYCKENSFFVTPITIFFTHDSIDVKNLNEPKISLGKEVEIRVEKFVSKQRISCVGCG